ncbi:MAG: hypothetical protein R3Y05_01305 [bacterium]
MAIPYEVDATQVGRAVAGEGSALYIQNENGKYSVLIGLETVPTVAGSYDSIDVNITNTNVVGKIGGKLTLDDTTFTFLLHRDNVRRLIEVSGKDKNFMVVTPDMMGQKFSGTIKFQLNEMTGDAKAEGEVTLTPSAMDEFPIMNALPLLEKTCKFTKRPAATTTVGSGDNTTMSIELFPENATVSVVAGTSADEGNANGLTMTESGGVLTITSDGSDSALASATFYITASASGYASWTTTVLVQVTE